MNYDNILDKVLEKIREMTDIEKMIIMIKMMIKSC